MYVNFIWIGHIHEKLPTIYVWLRGNYRDSINPFFYYARKIFRYLFFFISPG